MFVEGGRLCTMAQWPVQACMLSLAAQCIVIGPVCVFATSGRCGSVTAMFACIDFHQTGSVGEGSDHLQLIKFWPSCAPGKGLRRSENFRLHVTTASAQCLRLSERFFHCNFYAAASVARPCSCRRANCIRYRLLFLYSWCNELV